MRLRLSLACLCLVLAATAGCATAAQAPSAFELHTDDYERVRGEYALADGHAIRLVGTRRHPRIEFDDGASRPLQALSAAAFETPDGCIRVVFQARANGTVTRVDVTRPRGCASR